MLRCHGARDFWEVHSPVSKTSTFWVEHADGRLTDWKARQTRNTGAVKADKIDPKEGEEMLQDGKRDEVLEVGSDN